ncbi:hypothetical protein TBLA_0F02850 [Henningerozyma blattae CBS 6284]|uniref:CAAX prenyl protease n=1 Tax=Henningerozyma blattae (strain ATCC 34711 / CBS 6284 / DSM 70876 / NBRC 10599 / NRRL Y-10934 / UCD 77-7) TaxID=1071380 RepID=I2H622_HENB6|nr:hypothetical protein TBLA_0F02850 [Tetrapisispora blattae CBS 6284]CCH61824.1 hypothetical protein TBLA_0F02850 [Tetrapisispora blattae CBS 6284]
MAIFETLQTAFDSADIPWKSIITLFTVGQFAFETYLTLRQYKALNIKTLPPVLKHEIDQDTFDKSRRYSKAKAKFSIFSDVFGLFQNLFFIKYDVLPKLWNTSVMLATNYLPTRFAPVSTIAQSLCFLGLMTNLSNIIGLPLSYYHHFVLEEKFGFNKLTVKLWIQDMIKSNCLATLIGGPVLYLFLWIFDKFQSNFLWYICLFIFVVQILAMTIIPVFIMPLFNKFTPLEDGKLKKSIEDLASSVNFPLDKIFVIDGSKRSSHSNAYFTGLPFTSKRIVLYDTLVKESTVEEITAVLAHEIGHWQKNHVLNMVIFSQIHIFVIFSLFTSVYRNNSFYNSFGFFIGEKTDEFLLEKMVSSFSSKNSTVLTSTFPTIIGFMLFNDLLTPLDCCMQFGISLLSRWQEYQADAYAKSLKFTHHLSRALINLQIKNLSTMNVDSLYSSYHYSHPTLAERLSALGYVSEKKKE